jgi:DNA invertase Pin-like site-specific DNA recombinase
MSSTKIEWATAVWNPVVGCTKVSAGCKNCYAKMTHDRRHKAVLAGKPMPVQYAQSFETVQLKPERLTAPLHWRKPQRVFVNSVSVSSIERRPGLQAIVELADAGAIDVVVYHESSRLARDEELAQWLINRLERRSVRLVNMAKPDVDYRTSDGRFLFALDSTLDAYYRRKIGEHIRKGKSELFERGLPVGMLPFGYSRPAPGEVPLVVESEALAVREVFARRLAGVGDGEIAAWLNSAGYRPRSRQGYGQFTASSVRSMWENDFYAGWVRHLGRRRRGVHEALVTDEVWSRSQARPQERRGRPDGSRGLLLVGLARCAACGGKLWASRTADTGRGGWYREPSHLQFRECANAHTGWNGAEVDGVVSGVMRGLGLDADWLAAVAREARKVRKARSSVTVDRAALEGERARATRAYIAGALPEGEWLAVCARVDERLAGAEAGGGVTEVLTALGRLESFASLWDRATSTERREAVGIVLERAVLDTREKRLWLEPRGAYGGLFAHRRGWLRGEGIVGAPRAGAEGVATGLYAPWELVA